MKTPFCLFIIMCVIATSCGSRSQEDSSVQNSVGVGQTLPDFVLQDLNGDTLNSRSLDGKITVIHIATTWCPYCNAEAPYLEKLHQKYKDKSVQVLIIDVKESDSLVSVKLQDRFNFTFPVLLDSEGKVASAFAPKDILPDLPRDEIMIASNIIIGRNGKVEYMSLLDTKNFDAKLLEVERRLNEVL